MRRSLATLALAAVAVTPVVSAAPAEAVDCGLLRPVCGVVCRTTYEAFGWYCVA